MQSSHFKRYVGVTLRPVKYKAGYRALARNTQTAAATKGIVEFAGSVARLNTGLTDYLTGAKQLTPEMVEGCMPNLQQVYIDLFFLSKLLKTHYLSSARRHVLRGVTTTTMAFNLQSVAGHMLSVVADLMNTPEHLDEKAALSEVTKETLVAAIGFAFQMLFPLTENLTGLLPSDVMDAAAVEIPKKLQNTI
jgi:hypothetical protein